MNILKEHEHCIDCIAWAPLEAARTIELAEYSGGSFSQIQNGTEESRATLLDGDEEGEEDDKPQTVMQHKAKQTTAERIQ